MCSYDPGSTCLRRRFVDLTYDILHEFVFVTAVSSNHFNEMTVGLYHVREKFGVNKTVVVYDIGLLASQRKQVRVLLWFTLMCWLGGRSLANPCYWLRSCVGCSIFTILFTSKYNTQWL